MPTSTAGQRLSGRFAENVFSAEQVSGPRVQMKRRADGTWGGRFPCKPWLSHASNDLCPTDFDRTEIAIRMGGQPVFGFNRWPSSVVVARTGVQYEFALVDARPFPSELVMPLFLAVTSARELDSGLCDLSWTMRIYDPETRLSWEIQVEGLGRVSVRRGPTT